MRIDDLIVEDDREDHIARHNVTLEEVDQVIYGRHAADDLGSGLHAVIGLTWAGRLLTVIIGERGRYVYGLVTARDADRSERSLHRRRLGN